jgi:hypothetical protein
VPASETAVPHLPAADRLDAAAKEEEAMHGAIGRLHIASSYCPTAQTKRAAVEASMSALLPFLLRSLKYSSPVNPDDPAQFQKVVVWLENMKIRLYPADGRLQLQSQDASEWQAALCKYLADIHCPIDAANQRAVLQWLAAHAGAPPAAAASRRCCLLACCPAAIHSLCACFTDPHLAL